MKCEVGYQKNKYTQKTQLFFSFKTWKKSVGVVLCWVTESNTKYVTILQQKKKSWPTNKNCVAKSHFTAKHIVVDG